MAFLRISLKLYGNHNFCTTLRFLTSEKHEWKSTSMPEQFVDIFKVVTNDVMNYLDKWYNYLS